jgi:hypothetical protein
MHQQSSNLCFCVIAVHELSKCVTPVPERCSGLTAGPNGSRPVIRDDVAYLGGTRLPPRAAPRRPPATHSSASASKAAAATAAGRAGDTVTTRSRGARGAAGCGCGHTELARRSCTRPPPTPSWHACHARPSVCAPIKSSPDAPARPSCLHRRLHVAAVSSVEQSRHRRPRNPIRHVGTPTEQGTVVGKAAAFAHEQ